MSGNHAIRFDYIPIDIDIGNIINSLITQDNELSRA